MCRVTRYNLSMIKSFACKNTEYLFTMGENKNFPADIVSRALRKLDMLNSAYRLEDLRIPPSNRLHLLTGKKSGIWSISINDQWRICFRFKGEDAYDVEICDYH